MRVANKLILLFISVFFLANINAQVSVDVDLFIKKKISPYIYGVNGYADSSFCAVRLGGNRLTGYNWESNLSNAGGDNGSSSDMYLATPLPYKERTVPGRVLTYFNEIARSQGQYSFVTLPMAGYVADKAGVATQAPSDYWSLVQNIKSAEFTLSPDLIDKRVYVDEELNYLIQTIGKRKNGGIDAYSLDNESEYWHTSHPLIHKGRVTIPELLTKSENLAALIKKMDSDAEVVGPAFANLDGMKYLGAYSNKFPNVELGYSTFLDCFLDSMRRAEVRYGKRLLDVVDFHWYPKSIVNITKDANGNDLPDALDRDAISRRIQAPRMLWDSSYTSPDYASFKLIHFMRKSINKFYPGTKIGYTEYLYGAEDHYSGGLALADVLGVFGQEGVYLANKWYYKGERQFGDYGLSAFKLYRNYDGKGGMFGSQSVKTVISNLDSLSCFTSEDENNNLHLIVINKKSDITKVNFTINDAYYESASVWSFDSVNSSIIQRDSIKNINGSFFTYFASAYSATHIVARAAKQACIVLAETSDRDSSLVILKYSGLFLDKQISKSSVQLLENGVSFEIDTVWSRHDSLFVRVKNKFNKTSRLAVSIVGTILDEKSVPVKRQQNHNVINKLYTADLYVTHVSMLPDGYSFSIEFNKTLSLSSSLSGFTVYRNGFNNDVFDAQIMSNRIIFTMKKRFSNGDSILFSYAGSGLLADDDTRIVLIDRCIVPNCAPIVSPIILNSSVTDGGYGAEIVFDTPLKQTSDMMIAAINGDLVSCKYSLEGNKLLLRISERVKYGDELTFSYDTAGHVKSVIGGVLDKIVGYKVNNNLKTPLYIDIPTKIEAETFSFGIDNIVTSKTNDVGGGSHLSEMTIGSRFGYYISSSESKKCVLNMRFASTSSGGVIYRLNGRIVDTINFVGGGSWTVWNTVGACFDIAEGKSDIEFEVIKGGANINWFSFSFLDSIPVINAIRAKNGLSIKLIFALGIENVPSEEDFLVKDLQGRNVPVISIAKGKNSNELQLLLPDSVATSSLLFHVIGKKILFQGGYWGSDFVQSFFVDKEVLSSNHFDLFFDNKKLECTINPDDVFVVEIYSVTGQKVYYNKHVHSGESLYLDLMSGLYNVVITSGEDVCNKMIVKY